MPFEGFARNHSAEFIAAQRARSRSDASRAGVPNGSAGSFAEGGRPLGERTLSPGTSAAATFNPNSTSPPALFIVPSPVYAVMRNDDDPKWRPKSPNSPSSPRVSNVPVRVPSRGTGGRGRSLSTAAPIPESHEEDNPDRSPPSPRPSGENRSESDETLADRDRDIERGEGGKGSKTEGSGEKQGKEQENKKKDEEKDPFLVTLDGRQHLNPHTWNETYRWFLTGLAGLFVLNATFASSGPSQLIPSIITYFNVSSEVGTLTIALFASWPRSVFTSRLSLHSLQVAGYCVGPLLWGPLSERYGRKWVFVVAFIPYTAFQVGCALSPNIGALLAFRFLGGCFAASPLTNSGGVRLFSR